MENNTETFSVSIMKHAEERIQQRMGLKRKAAKRQFKLALERGLALADMTGDLKMWARTQAKMHNEFDREAILFNGHLFIYTTQGALKTCMTVLDVKKNLLAEA